MCPNLEKRKYVEENMKKLNEMIIQRGSLKVAIKME